MVSALLTAGADKEAKDEVNGVRRGVMEIGRISWFLEEGSFGPDNAPDLPKCSVFGWVYLEATTPKQPRLLSRVCKHSRGKKGVLLETSCAPQDGDTPLQMALVFDHPAVVEKLLAGGVDKEAKNKVRGGVDGQWR